MGERESGWKGEFWDHVVGYETILCGITRERERVNVRVCKKKEPTLVRGE